MTSTEVREEITKSGLRGRGGGGFGAHVSEPLAVGIRATVERFIHLVRIFQRSLAILADRTIIGRDFRNGRLLRGKRGEPPRDGGARGADGGAPR